MKLLIAQQIQKKYKQKIIVDKVSFKVNEGECVGIIGPNGAGKSTLLKMLATVEKPSQGTLRFHELGYDGNIKKIRKKVGYIPQDIALFEELTVKQQIQSWSRLSQGKIDKRHVDDMIEILRLNEVMKKRTSDLSGGWKRKLNLCIGILHKPELCLLDEPTAGIDIAARKEIMDWLKRLQQQGMTLMFISHDWHELRALSDRLLIVDQGRLLFDGTIDEMKFMKYDDGSRDLSNIVQAGLEYEHGWGR
ncbi:ABC transporter ATP-binding protein [Thalassobacillus hwangdonensis]|uniref:ABC transporter ATP-binding protein n=1 Tax=Thalassobacillus hwangdonensis TaxID=546108 RepID=A0ABW3KVG1_9BACI